MTIKPYDIQQVPEIPDELNQILMDAGAAPKASPITSIKKLDINEARKALNTRGASVDNVAMTIAQILGSGENDNNRLKAAEIALKIHGIIQEIDEKTIPNVTINITGNENKTLINLVLPTV